jgi:hypothetical protein
MKKVEIEEIKNKIKSNWTEIENIIKTIKNYDTIKFQSNGINLFFKCNEEIIIKIELEKDQFEYIIDVSRFSRIISFYPEKDNNPYEEIIFKPVDIMYYINKYKMDNAIYRDEDMNENISIKSEDCIKILENPNITKIIEDQLICKITKEKFDKYQLDTFDNLFLANSVYINFPKSDISTLIVQNNILYSDEKTKLHNNINSFMISSRKKIFIIGGPEKIGKTNIILSSLQGKSVLYFNFKLLDSEFNNIKKKIILRECMHLFEEYNEFKEFINEAFKIKGYKDILTIIKEFNFLISEYTLPQDKNMIESKFYLENPVIVLDDYDDINMKDNIIDETFINQLCKDSKDKVKYIICGNGKFINKILYEYLIEGICDYEYEINYFNDFDFKINNKKVNNLLLEVSKKNWEENFNKNIEKIYSKETIVQNLIILNELIKIKYQFKYKDRLLEIIPRQYLNIIQNKELKFITFEYQFPEMINNFQTQIKLHLLENYTINKNYINNNWIYGHVIEELIIGLFEVNKLINDLEFPKENIIEVDSIFNIQKEEKIKNILDDYPILIKQRKQGQDYDFGIVLRKNDLNYGILIQVGLNKEKSEIYNIYINSFLRYYILKDGISNVIGRNIDYLSLLFFFEHEIQNDLLSKLIEKQNIGKFKLKKRRSYKYIENYDEIEKLNCKIGINACKIFNIPYFTFSHKDKKLYNEGKYISDLETFKTLFWPIKNENLAIEIILDKSNVLFKDIFTEKEITQLKNFSDFKNCKDFIIRNEIKYSFKKCKYFLLMIPILNINEESKILIYNINKKEIKYIKIDNDQIYRLDEKKIKNLKFEKSYLIELVYKKEEDFIINETNIIKEKIGKMKINEKYGEKGKKVTKGKSVGKTKSKSREKSKNKSRSKSKKK